MVVDAGDQVEAKAKPLAPVPVTVRNDPKPLQRADHMLVQDPFARHRTVESLVLCYEAQRQEENNLKTNAHHIR